LRPEHMKIPKITPVMFTGAMMLWIIGCTNKPVLTHKLVVTGNQHSVPLYPDEQTYLKVSHLSQQGGVSGMVGDAQKNLSAKKIDDQTPVIVISSDDNGTQVQITEGPMKGQAGFVANQNVD
jgi:hypothetical protein